MSGAQQAYAVTHHGRRYYTALMPLAKKPEGKTSVVHVAYEGTWDGHPSGSIEFTAQVFDALVSRFESQQNPMPVDYEHSSMSPSPTGSPAAGWIHELWRDGGNLYARVEWTDRAAEYIRRGEYRYCSPVIDFDSIDRKTGESVGPEMFNLALTNNPFLDGQKPIRLRAREAREHMDKSYTDMIARVLMSNVVVKKVAEAVIDALPAKATPEQVMQAAGAAATLQSAAQESPDEPDESPAEMGAAAAEPVQMDAVGADDAQLAAGQEVIAILAEASGLDEAGVLDAVRARAEELGALLASTAAQDGTPAEIAEESIAASRSTSNVVSLDKARADRDRALATVVELRAARRSEQAAQGMQRTVDDRRRAVDALVRDGLILEPEREGYMQMSATVFATMLAAAQAAPRVPTGTQARDEPAPSIDTSDPDYRAAVILGRGQTDAVNRYYRRIKSRKDNGQ